MEPTAELPPPPAIESLPQVEVVPQDQMETAPTRAESTPSPQENRPPAPISSTFAGIPTPAPLPSAGSTSQTAVSDVPVEANDTDRIEPAWVRATEQVINEHKEDPFQQEQGVAHLRKQYRQKRFSKSSASDLKQAA